MYIYGKKIVAVSIVEATVEQKRVVVVILIVMPLLLLSLLQLSFSTLSKIMLIKNIPVLCVCFYHPTPFFVPHTPLFQTCVQVNGVLSQLLQFHKLLLPSIFCVVVFTPFLLFVHDCCCCLCHHYCQHQQFLRCFLSGVWQFLIASTLFTLFSWFGLLHAQIKKLPAFLHCQLFGMFVCQVVGLLLLAHTPPQKLLPGASYCCGRFIASGRVCVHVCVQHFGDSERVARVLAFATTPLAARNLHCFKVPLLLYGCCGQSYCCRFIAVCNKCTNDTVAHVASVCFSEKI